MMRERRVSREAIWLSLGSKRLAVRQRGPSQKPADTVGTAAAPALMEGPRGGGRGYPSRLERPTDGDRFSWRLDARSCTTANAALSAGRSGRSRASDCHA